MHKILFDSASLPGDGRLRKEQWVDSLSSGYARLRAGAVQGVDFDGKLKIVLLANASIGTISGTVHTIARTQADIATENTDNVVLLFNSGADVTRIEQKGKAIDCARGGAVMIEQCRPSFVKVAPQAMCSLVAVQVPRGHVVRAVPDVEDRFMIAPPPSSAALALARVYVDTLIDHFDADNPGVPRFASDHIADLVAAAVDPECLCSAAPPPGLRAARLAMIDRELDRNFMRSEFSLPLLARRIGVTPRYVQALFADVETSFTDELTRRRLLRAHDMLVSARYAHLNVVDIAHECGFSTVSHFHRVFRRRFEATPGAVRGGKSASPAADEA
jgi:AraC-like DNA-binding protein